MCVWIWTDPTHLTHCGNDRLRDPAWREHVCQRFFSKSEKRDVEAGFSGIGCVGGFQHHGYRSWRVQYVGGLIGGNGQSVSDSSSTGTVTGAAGSDIGGFVGDAFSGTVANSYWDTTTSGVTNLSQGAGNHSNDPGISGLTTTQLQSGLPAGFSNSIWGESPTINGGLPYLLANPPQ